MTYRERQHATETYVNKILPSNTKLRRTTEDKQQRRQELLTQIYIFSILQVYRTAGKRKNNNSVIGATVSLYHARVHPNQQGGLYFPFNVIVLHQNQDGSG